VSEFKDSGDRTTFSTGAQRDRSYGKGKPSLVPNWVVWLVSRIYEDGAKKYASRNWEKGMNLSAYIDSLERHLAKLKAGRRDEPHASQVAWNILGYIYTAAQVKMGKRPAELNDMPDQTSENPLALAEPLSPYEYEALQSFFDIPIGQEVKTAWQYLAGMFDGEGTISIIRRERSRREAYSLRLTLHSTNKSALEQIQKDFEGVLGERDRGNPKHAIAYHLTWNHQQAGEILKNIAPFLLIKKTQATLGLEFQRIASGLQKYGRKGIPKDVLENLRVLKKAINLANRKGRKNVGNSRTKE